MSKAQLFPRTVRRAHARQARAARPFLSLAMIVRNEQAGLARCLASVAGAVDEVVIVDTGSTDETKAIAFGFTDRVYDYAWGSDFAAAREFAFGLARGEWMLWLDGDDEVAGAAALGELLRAQPADVHAVELKYVVGRELSGEINCEFWRERCVRAGSHKWAGRVHEVLVPTGAGRQIQSAACVITHHGKGESGAAGLARNVGILRAELAEQQPPLPRTLFYLGRDLLQLGEVGESESVLRRYLTIAEWAEERYVAQLYVGRLCALRSDYAAAQQAGLAALAEWPAWPQAYFFLAELAYYRKQWARVLGWCDIGRGLGVPDAGLFVDPLALKAGWIIYYTNALYHLGHLPEALEWTRRALDVLPGDLWHQRNLAFFTAVSLGASAGAPRAPGVELTAPAPIQAEPPVQAAAS